MDREEFEMPETDSDLNVCTLIETVNLARLEAAAAFDQNLLDIAGDGPCRADALALRTLNAYIARCRAEGRCYGLYCDLRVIYYIKFGIPGRRYPRGPALAKLKRCYRTVACDALCFQIDQKNAIPCIAWDMAQQFLANATERLNSWHLYQENYKEWRCFMQDYADIPLSDAKKSITKMFGLGLPDYDIPFLWALSMDVYTFRAALQRSPKYNRLSAMFTDRKNPEATRFFYALSPVEDERTMRAVSMFEIDAFASISALIFDGAIMTSASTPDEIREKCAACERALGFQMSIDIFDGAFCVARKLLVSGHGSLAGDLPPSAGNLRCLFDAVSFLRPNMAIALPSACGPYSVYDFNVHMRESQQAGGDAVWLIFVPADEAWAAITGVPQAKRQRVVSDQCMSDWVCWQPYDDENHFFGLRVESPTHVVLLDSHIATSVRASIDAFRWAAQADGRCALQFFRLTDVQVAMSEVMDAEYHLRGGVDSEGESSSPGSSPEDASSDEDSTSDTYLPYSLLRLVAAEKEAFFAEKRKRYDGRKHQGHSYVCELCPHRAFWKRTRLVAHESQHSRPHCCTSRKQLRVLKAIHAERCAAQASSVLIARTPSPIEQCGLLKASADQVRAMLQDCPSFHLLGTRLTILDDVIAWGLTADGMRVILKCDAAEMGFKRSGYTYYSQDFMRLLLSFSIDPRTKCAIKRVHNRLMTHWNASRRPVPFLLPSRPKLYLLLKECLEQHSFLVTRARELLQRREAFKVVTVDCAFKFLMSVKRQPKHGASQSGMPYRDGLHAVATARSMDGCMFMATAFPSENPLLMIPQLAAIPGVFQQVKVLGVDRPGDWDVVAVHAALPSLQCIMGDPMHLVFAVSSCYGESQKPGVVCELRAIAEKLCAVGPAQWLQRPFYRRLSGEDRSFSVEETACVTTPRMTASTARRLLKKLDTSVPYKSRLQFIRAIVALRIAYSTELGRHTADGKVKLGDVLQRALHWRNIEYYANGARWRNQNDIPRATMATGTVGNEGHHRDMKGWAQNVFAQTRDRAVVVLQAWELSKLIRHEATFYSPTLGRWETSEGEWLARVLAKAPDFAIHLRDAPMTVRTGSGDRDVLRAASVQQDAGATLMKKPALKRPASVLKYPGFESVWKRRSKDINF